MNLLNIIHADRIRALFSSHFPEDNFLKVQGGEEGGLGSMNPQYLFADTNDLALSKGAPEILQKFGIPYWMINQVKHQSLDSRTVVDSQVQRAIITTVVAGYITHFISISASDKSDFPFSPLTVAAAVLLGSIYVFAVLRQLVFFDRYSLKWATIFFLVAQLTLLFIIQFMLAFDSIGGIWLIPLPLAPTIVRRVKSRWRWLFYLLIVAVVALPIGIRFGDWNGVLIRALIFSPALLFVVAYTGLRLSEQNALQRLEKLAEQVQGLATERERNRLAREIHDTLGHYLTAIHMQLEAARAVIASDPEGAQLAIGKAQGLTQNGLMAIRQAVSAIRESPTEKWTLPEAIAALLEEIKLLGAVIKLDIDGIPRKIEPQAKLTLFRVAQEGLTNARKHAKASRVDLKLDYTDPDAVKLIVEDDGIGMAQTNSEGFGMVGMRERVQMLGGEVIVITGLGKGFTLSVSVPA